jgi:hypothetical protein
VITKLQWSHRRLNSATNFTKPEKNNKYFWVFRILKTRAKGNSKQSKIFLDFSNTKLKIRNKENQSKKTEEENKEKQRKYFWSFCVLESRNKNNNQQRKENEKWI